jgi:hypothetical protein
MIKQKKKTKRAERFSSFQSHPCIACMVSEPVKRGRDAWYPGREKPSVR